MSAFIGSRTAGRGRGTGLPLGVALVLLAGPLAAASLDLAQGCPAGFAAEAFAQGTAPTGSVFTANPARKGVAPDGNFYSCEMYADARQPSFTAQGFVRAAKTGAFAHVMTQRREGGSGSSWSLSLNPNGRLSGRFDVQTGPRGDGFNTTVTSSAVVDDGGWHHVALTVDGRTRMVELFCDYRRVGGSQLRGPLVYNKGPFRIGQGLEGELKGLRIDSGVLSPDSFSCAPWFLRAREERAACSVPAAYDDTYTRVQTGVRPPFPRAGTLIPKRVAELSTSRWSVGCECLERNLASWDAYKDYLPLLGIRKIRIQGGWFRTEKAPGEYDFKWLDRIVDDAHRRGLEVCLETSYRNPLYAPRAPTGPNERGFDDWSDGEYAAWDRWVEAMVRRYTPRGVREWMMYNEPNLGMGSLSAEQRAARWKGILENNLRTAAIVKRVNPQAKVAAFVLAGLAYGPITNMLDQAKAQGKLGLLDSVVFHGYSANPDALVPQERELVAWLNRNAPHVRAWQGEAGCASEEVQYAMSGVPWTEFSQAKWNARRMLCDLACDVDSLLFTISDLSYNRDFISRYGLLKTRADNSVISVKMAFYTAQNVVNVFSDDRERMPGCVPVFEDLSDPKKRIGFAAFRDRATGESVLALWDASRMPDENRELAFCTVAIPDGRMTEPVWLDLVNGQAWEIPADRVTRESGLLRIAGVPYYDGPAALVPRALLELERPKSYRRQAAPNASQAKKALAK